MSDSYAINEELEVERNISDVLVENLKFLVRGKMDLVDNTHDYETRKDAKDGVTSSIGVSSTINPNELIDNMDENESNTNTVSGENEKNVNEHVESLSHDINFVAYGVELTMKEMKATHYRSGGGENLEDRIKTFNNEVKSRNIVEKGLKSVMSEMKDVKREEHPKHSKNSKKKGRNKLRK